MVQELAYETLSRQKYPKQFIPLWNERSLFQDTVNRNRSVVDEFLVVSNVELHHLVQQQLEQEQQTARCILEPMGRNTAPAIALSCLMLNPDDILLVTTSDHIIAKREAYVSAVKQAIAFAREGQICTFGVQPTHPETGFGYIGFQGNDVLQFRENFLTWKQVKIHQIRSIPLELWDVLFPSIYNA